MKKLPHAFGFVISLLIFLIASAFSIMVYYLVGISQSNRDPKVATLFSILKEINYSNLLNVFMYFVIYLIIIDLFLVWMRVSWRKMTGREAKFYGTGFKNRLKGYWYNHRMIHISFILLSIFLTISVMAPSMVMNAFTAIVSISVLITTNIKKIENKE